MWDISRHFHYHHVAMLRRYHLAKQIRETLIVGLENLQLKRFWHSGRWPSASFWVGTLLKVLRNSVFQFFVVFAALSICNGMTKLEYRMREATTRSVAFFNAKVAAILTSPGLSAKTAEVSSKLMHDVETNPGPNCSGVSSFVIYSPGALFTRSNRAPTTSTSSIQVRATQTKRNNYHALLNTYPRLPSWT